MKKLFALSIFAVSLASANTIVLDCPQLAILVASNTTGTENCSGFTGALAVPAGATINSISLRTTFDFTYNALNEPLPVADKTVSYNFAFPGGLNVSGTIAASARPEIKTTTACNSNATCSAYLAAFTVNDSLSGIGSAVTGATFDKRLTLDYTPSGTIPEPSTLALVGLALVGVGIARRR